MCRVLRQIPCQRPQSKYGKVYINEQPLVELSGGGGVPTDSGTPIGDSTLAVSAIAGQLALAMFSAARSRVGFRAGSAIASNASLLGLSEGVLWTSVGTLV